MAAMNTLRRLAFETDGQDTIEYALLTTFIGFAGAAALTSARSSLGNLYTVISGGVWNAWEPANPAGGGS
jgi:Flp pilus assembly pilin Flp